MQHISRISVAIVASALITAGCKSSSGPDRPGPPAQLAAVSDTLGSGVVDMTLQDSLVVIVRDADQRAVPGASVVWGISRGDGTIAPTATITDSEGRARTSWHLGRQSGRQDAFAQVSTGAGLATVNFHRDAAPGTTTAIQVTVADSVLPRGDTRAVTLSRTDAFGNSITDRAATWTTSNPAVATVNASTGVVTAVSRGVVDITATSEGRSATVRLTIREIGQDAFETNTFSLYTQQADMSADWGIIGGVMTAQGAASQQSQFIRSDVTFQDGWVEAEIDRADEGGLVLRFRDRMNFVLLAIRDDGSLLGGRNLEIYRRVNGRFDLLAERDLSWSRGTVKTVRFEAVGGVLRGYMDGSLVLQTNDATIPAAGVFGMRYHDVPEDPVPDFARYLSIRWNGI